MTTKPLHPSRRLRRSFSSVIGSLLAVGSAGMSCPSEEPPTVGPTNVVLDPPVIVFRDPPHRVESERTVRLLNMSTHAINFALCRYSGFPVFQVEPSAQWVPAWGRALLRVRYTPVDRRRRKATQEICISDTEVRASLPIKVEYVAPYAMVSDCLADAAGTCVAPPDDDRMIGFGDVPTGTCARAQVIVANDGADPLELTAAFAAGGSPELRFAGAVPGPLSVPGYDGTGEPNGQAIAVEYCPTTAGPAAATLVLATNDAQQPTVEIMLTGNGTAVIGDGCGPAEACDNGLDDDCDGHVDEGCACTFGDVRTCFAGPPGRRGVGACTDGTMRCTGDGAPGAWGACTGGIVPRDEVCDSLDNDCDGADDEGLNCGPVTFACPDSASLPEGVPFQDYVLDASSWVTGMAASWSWSVQGGPCDQLFATTTNPVRQSFTLTGQNTSTLRFRPSLSGDYTVTSSIVDGTGVTHACTFVVHVAGPGLRVEMCSDRSADTDLDLHLHRPNTPAVGWFAAAGNSACSYLNCKAASFNPASWGYATSPLANCVGGPEGADWQAVGHCRNPRLDIDSIEDSGVPENINVDVPENAAYRVMVNYFAKRDGSPAPVRPLVNVYCGGRLKATYGQAPDLVPSFDQPGQNTTGDMWRVVDVTPTVVNGVTTDCTLAPLHPPDQMSGYWVAPSPRTY
jgi:hypothetical protein